mgnify:CR=1 FL=1
MKGIYGKYLDLNLSEQTYSDYKIPQEWYEKHLGGRGIGSRILIDILDGGEDPLGPKNILVFASGPLQGTSCAGAGRHALVSRSPKSKTIHDSYAGGYWGHELGKSGYDGLVIRGKASTPVYISIIDSKVEIHKATDIWGKTTASTDEILKEKHNGVRVSCIGPAGEKLIPFSCVINDKNRAAGRPGFGAVMGSKNLKAIAISGSKNKPLFNGEKFQNLKSKFAEHLLEDPVMGGFGKMGTPGNVEPLNETGMLPTKNFKKGVFDGADRISGEKLEETLLSGRGTCQACPVRCKRVCEGEFSGDSIKKEHGGPEYETIAAFGSLCLNDDISSIALANQKCNQYGLDTISTGNVLAFAMEATEKGLLDPGINWGDSEDIVQAIDNIVSKDGVGKLLSQGLESLAKEIGGEEFAVHVKGMEVPLHEPRAKKGLGLSYATSPRGAAHMETVHDTDFQADNTTPFINNKNEVESESWENKVELCKIYEDMVSYANSLIICAFNSWARIHDDFYAFSLINNLLNSVTGKEVDLEEMLEIGERNYAIRKIVTAKDGYTMKDDDLPERLKKPLKNGLYEGEKIPDTQLKSAIKGYYEKRGFDEYGPTDNKLRSLGLDNLVGEIER